MNIAQEVRKQIRANVDKRRKVLNEKYANVSPDQIDAKAIEEGTGIGFVYEMLDQVPSQEEQRRRQISITTSAQEAWYRNSLNSWAQRHPEAGVDSDNNAGLYRFAMKFFVENVVLNPKNTMLHYGDLTSKMAKLDDMDPVLSSIDFLLNTKLEDIRELVSFNAAMSHMEFTRAMSGDRDLSRGILSNDIHTEIEKVSEFAQDYEKYRSRRRQDIAAHRMRRPDEGLEFNHE
ncbi:hypothetical protein [uncultured Weissella sp.]|uniref:hypothetical protein n=1 Tax=uncultured Weissella sp. TaxID=253243 RepID=UPI002588C0B9|nr:hypothetical protein [uncultured Weissella sp.]